MKKLFSLLIVISAVFFFCSCSISYRLRQNEKFGNFIEDALEKGQSDKPALTRTYLADIYNTRAQLLLATPGRESEADEWIQKSLEECNFVRSQFPEEYANNSDNIAVMLDLVMANNMFLQNKQGEAGQWCSRVPENVKCPAIIKELQ
ncbi:hypothetical protein J5690_09920 [bacterium]|nr:hypothetical protein [bacterium]